jgi:hypothetical protein
MRRLLIGVLVAGVLSGLGAASAAASSINLIAPWGSAVLGGSDSIALTYSVNGKNVPATALAAVSDAASTWTSWLSSNDGSGSFAVTVGSGRGVNVPITIKQGGGMIAGQTKLSFDRQGFIKAATVQISGSSFGLANDYPTIYEIALHELGHAFVGLNHSDDANDLMYPYLNGVSTVGTCELSGFNALYGWLKDGSSNTGPTLPSVGSVTC